MTDIVDREARSHMMSGIKGRDTKPEVQVRSLLHRSGFRFRLHGQRLPGRPDVVLTRWQAVIFVHGCFWHRHSGCKFSYEPKSNVGFWRSKFEANVTRDRRVARKLRVDGWRVFVIWTCAVSPARIARLGRAIRGEDR